MLPAQVHCHQCGACAWVTADGLFTPQPAAGPAPALGILVPANGMTQPTNPPPQAALFQAYPAAPAARCNELVLAGIAAGSVLFLALTIMLLIVCLKAPDAGNSTPMAESPSPGEAADPVAISPPGPAKSEGTPSAAPPVLSWVKTGPPADADLVAVTKTGAALPAALKIAGSVHPGVDHIKVGEAVARGVAYLRHPGTLTGRNTSGYHALAGLTLLSCGTPAADAVVTRCADMVRSKAGTLVNTYDLALSILFLDPLGEIADRALMRRLALQLIAGQGVTGGWGYTSSTLNSTEEDELLKLLKINPKSSAQVPGKATKVEPRSKTTKLVPGMAPGFGRPAATGPRLMKNLPVFQFQPGRAMVYRPGPYEDNSLTQFAILALWSAQIYGIPAERSLAMAEARFRASQADDGSWCYTWRDVNRCKYSMTCAGLLGLAAGRGSERSRTDGRMGTSDPAIEKALRFVSQEIGTDHLAKWLKSKVGAYNDGTSGWGGLYFLWSLERAAVVYDLRTIGGKDWYAWGAPLILETQKADGRWRDTFPGVADTCFALLFLKRTNVVQDLTQRIQFLTMSKEVGMRERESEPVNDLSFGRRSEFSGNVPPGRVRGLKDDR